MGHFIICQKCCKTVFLRFLKYVCDNIKQVGTYPRSIIEHTICIDKYILTGTVEYADRSQIVYLYALVRNRVDQHYIYRLIAMKST